MHLATAPTTSTQVHLPERAARWREMLIALVGLTLLDAAATVLWLGLGMAEGNPLLARLIEHTSVGFAMAVRAAIGASFALGLYRIGDRSKLAYGGMTLAVVALGLTAGWHGGIAPL